MATQSLYRRYRPQRFSELKGQDHVVRALRDAVAAGRSGQAYLFSGPRGTGKTTTARILAKVLNCERPVDGEPCCECESCLAVERGTSYDVHELDAASNRGVENIRELIERASLGTPGRHKVYILDEAHMLTAPASAALLKTLEEPPDHVVFVLATTDPQKLLDTIRSRTQHLQFHLLAADTLDEHVRWVADDAGLEVSDDAIREVLSQGGGSPRDTLSALELAAATGGEADRAFDPGEVVGAIADHDTGRALAAVAHAIQLGRDPRTLTEDIVRHLRDAFLAMMAPELVHQPADRVDGLGAEAVAIGAPRLVRGIERLGRGLVDMRHAPDPRILLEVALVELTAESAATDAVSLAARIDQLEARMATGVPGPSPTGVAGASTAAEAAPAPVDPASGRAVLGGRAKRAAGRSSAPIPDGASDDRATPGDDPPARASDPEADPEAERPAGATPPSTPGGAPGHDAPGDTAPDGTATRVADRPEQPIAASSGIAAASAPGMGVREAWEQVRPTLKPIVRAMYSAGSFDANDGDRWYFTVPSAAHGDKCDAHRPEVERALSELVGRPIQVSFRPGGPGTGTSGARSSGDATAGGSTRAPSDLGGDPPASAPSAPASGHHADPIDADLADYDPDELTDAPPETVRSPIDRLAEAFPGAQLVDDPD